MKPQTSMSGQIDQAAMPSRRKSFNGRKYALTVIGALLAPILLMLALFKRDDLVYKRFVLTILVTIYGSTFIIVEGQDGWVHQMRVYFFYMDMTFSQFMSDLWLMLRFQLPESNMRDVYQHTVSYLTGSVLGMPRLFFPIIAFVYGWFFSGAVLEVLKNFRPGSFNYVVIAFVAIFLLIKNVEGINTVRTWSGFWVLMYACLRYYSTGKLRYALLMFTPPLFHVAYFVMAVPAWLILLMGDRKKLLAIAFVLSSVTTFIPAGTATDFFTQTELGEHQVRAYYRDQTIDAAEMLTIRVSGGDRWYRAFERAKVHHWALNVLVYVLIFSGAYSFLMSKFQSKIFSIGLLTLTLANSLWYFSALNNRLTVIGAMFCIGAFIMARTDPARARQFVRLPGFYRQGLHLSLLLYFPYCVWALSHFLDFPSFFTFFVPFVVWMDPDLTLSVKEALRWLFVNPNR